MVGLVCAAAAQTQSFDVASVRPADRPYLQIAPQRSGGRISYTTDLVYLVAYAYDIPRWRISGSVPDSMHIFAIEATTSPDATPEQVRAMFRTLLSERFKLTTHLVTKDEDGFALTAPKGGARLREAKAGEALEKPWLDKGVAFPTKDGEVMATLASPGVAHMTARNATMSQLARGLENFLRAFVRDETALSGDYFIAVEFAPKNSPPETDLPELPTAIQEQLGLRLERRKGPVETLVIDHLEKTPTEN